MPELPEVETIRRTLTSVLIGQEIQGVEVLLEKAVKPSSEQLIRALVGRKIVELRRRGKYLLLLLDDDSRVAFHLRMTGRLLFLPKLTPLEKHTTLVLNFTDDHSLRFVDPRKFGTVVLYWPSTPPEGLKKLGPEPLETEKAVVVSSLTTAAARRKGPVKGLLLDQRVIAGLGNIYTDETLFLAGIRPTRSVREITAAEWEKIYQSILTVLELAIEHRGTSRRDYVDGRGEPGNHQCYLQVYDRKKKPCLVCGSEIQYTRVAGRGTHYCPACQH